MVRTKPNNNGMIRTKPNPKKKTTIKKNGELKSKNKTISDKKRGRGAPSKWKPEYVELAFNYCKLGAIEEDLAAFFDVTIDCITKWKKKYPDLLLSIKRGRREADFGVVKSMYHRARGYSHPDVHISNFKGEITVTPITKHYPPDVGACVFWLKNRTRHSDKPWSDKWEIDADDNRIPLEKKDIQFVIKDGNRDK